MNITDCFERLSDGKHLNLQESEAIFSQLMAGELEPAQIGGLLMALRVNGETPEEIAGAAKAMRAASTKVDIDLPNLVDTCGTGGSGGAKLFNVSTAAAFVAAATGAHVAKHGNRAMSSKSGSADVLEAAGVSLALTPEQVGRCITDVGVGFLFAQAHHSAMRFAGPVRKALGVRTLFNILGPMTNPAGAKRQVIGIFSAELQNTMAEVLALLDAEHVLIVHSNGLDELSLAGPSRIVELRNGTIDSYEITPEDVGLQTRSMEELHAPTIEDSLRLVKQSLREPDSAAAELVSFNAGAAVYAAGIAPSLKHGVAMASDAISAGLAEERLKELARISSLMAETS